MAYLDVRPMTAALRTMPEEFELNDGWLQHTPSRHNFKINPGGRVQIRAQCNCAHLAVDPEQESDLVTSFHEWQANYWMPFQINREFASHFRHRSALRRLLIHLTERLHHRLLRLDGGRGHEHVPVMAPAE